MLDLLAPAFLANPYPVYHRLRQTDPLHRSGGFCFATRNSDISSILRDKRFGKDFRGRLIGRCGPQILDEPVYRSMQRWMLERDPPQHTRLRGLMSGAFSPERLEQMRPQIERTVHRLIDRMEPRGQGDLIADFAFRLPVIVMCELLGIPDDHRPMFFAGGRGHGQHLDPAPTPAEIAAANKSHLAAERYFTRLVELRRCQPSTDLTTHLIRASENGGGLDDEELIANLILLFGAGHETTANLIGNAILALFRNPDQLDLVRHHPGLIENAIHEFLRYDSSVQTALRVAMMDVELGGRLLHKGEIVISLLAAGNRDPSVYERPDELDLTREKVRPLSFGGGIHYCVGAQLARIEAELAVSILLQRLPTLRLQQPATPTWRPLFVLRGLKTLPAMW